jgi:UDP-glucose 4-epimerase
MTRFLLTLEQATNIVFDALHYGEAGDTYIPDLGSCNIMDLAEVMIGNRKIEAEFIGIRPGEKIHELLISEEEISRTIKRGHYYVIRPILPELQPQEISKPVLNKELSSADTTLSKKDLKEFLEEEGLLNF